MQTELSDNHDGNTNERGNSLFSEVDDRRQIVEAKLKRFKDQFESMKIQYDKKVQQLQKVKTQNVALLNRVSADVNVDHGQVLHLQDLLERERNKNKILNELLENINYEQRSKSKAGISNRGSTTQDLLQLQIRQNLEADGKLQELTRKLATMERCESKLRAENYQLRTELSDLKHRTSENDNYPSSNVKATKSKNEPIREFIKFDTDDTIQNKENISVQSSGHDNDLLKLLSENLKINRATNTLTNTTTIAFKEKDPIKPRRAQFSDSDPVVYGGEDQNTQTKEHAESGQNNFNKKTTELTSGTRGRRTTNNLINAKQESEKLKEQCAQQ